MEKRKWIVRAVCILLTVLMAASVLGPLAYTAYADEETPKEKLDRIQQELQDLEDKIEDTKDDISKQQELKQYYQQQSNTLKAQIEALSAQISETEATLQAKQEELGNKILEVEQSKADFEDRLVAMYEMSRQSNLSILLGIDDFSEMLRFGENLQAISTNDTRIIENLKTEQAELEAQKAEVETLLSELSAQNEQLNASMQQYQQSVQQADAAISAEEAALDAQSEEYKQKQQEYKAAQQEWAAWAGSNTGNSYVLGDGTGQFAWPIPGYTTLSSDFGTVRYIYGVRDVHRGMDVPAPAGTPIYAAADGVVSTKAHWSYGTCVKISHSPSLVTIYGHMSARAAGITDGVFVTKGQLIGYVGSTGNSTGNHLHFEVNVSGTPVSAWPYLSS